MWLQMSGKGVAHSQMLLQDGYMVKIYFNIVSSDFGFERRFLAILELEDLTRLITLYDCTVQYAMYGP